MVSSDYKKQALKKLNGRWGEVALIAFLYSLIIWVFQFLARSVPFLSLGLIVVEIPLVFGLVLSFYKIFNNGNPECFDFFTDGFKNFERAWGISLRILVKLIVPFILIIVSVLLIAFGSMAYVSKPLFQSSYEPDSNFIIFIILGSVLLVVSSVWFIVKNYYYAISKIIAVDNPDLSTLEVVEKSKTLMTGNRAKLFVLQLSFIGWAILCVFTLGIGYFWLTPYIQFAEIAFYKNLIGDNGTIEIDGTEKIDDLKQD
jgi:uncharacterized membrane protein